MEGRKEKKEGGTEGIRTTGRRKQGRKQEGIKDEEKDVKQKRRMRKEDREEGMMIRM